jgi:hypothetical protein
MLHARRPTKRAAEQGEELKDIFFASGEYYNPEFNKMSG